jgi:hypothetical protein
VSHAHLLSVNPQQVPLTKPSAFPGLQLAFCLSPSSSVVLGRLVATSKLQAVPHIFDAALTNASCQRGGRQYLRAEDSSDLFGIGRIAF